MDFGSVAVVSIWSFSTFVCSGIDVHHFMDIETTPESQIGRKCLFLRRKSVVLTIDTGQRGFALAGQSVG